MYFVFPELIDQRPSAPKAPNIDASQSRPYRTEGRWFDSTSSRNVGTLNKSFTRNCIYTYDVMWRPVEALRLNSTPVIACYHPFILYL